MQTTRLSGYFLAASLGFGLFAGSASAETLKIGVAAPFSGDAASYGLPVQNGVDLAVKEINANGGVLGMQLEMVAEDDMCEANAAENVAKKMVAADIKLIVGHLCSGATKAALPSYREANALVVSPASTHPDLTLTGENPNFFRTIAHDAAQAELQVNFAVNALKIKRAAVIHDNSDYGKGLAELVKAELEQNSVKAALFEGIDPSAAKASYAALIKKLKQNKVSSSRNTAVFFAGRHPQAARFVVEARKKRNNAHFISGDGVKDPDFLKSAGRYALNYYVSAPADASQLEMARQVGADYKAAYDSEVGLFSLQAYAAVQALAHAVEKAGGTDDLAALSAALKGSSIDTPLGSISFDERGDIVGAGYAMYQVQPGFVAVD